LKALILAAGMGSRLMPLTSDTPKALVRVNGITLLERAIRKLTAEGFTEIIVNVHHFAGQIIRFLDSFSIEGVSIAISDESDQLLDTGGAILKARPMLDGKEPFLVHNVDVISNISLKSMLAYHIEHENLATLSVIDRQTSRYFLFDDTLRLKGWKDVKKGELRWTGLPEANLKPLAFSGIHVISPVIFELMEEKGRFSIIDAYLRLAGKHPVSAYEQANCIWFDIGKPGQIELVSDYLAHHPEMYELL
jgi:NDP-sugar pyrophosphorylase family protein